MKQVRSRRAWTAAGLHQGSDEDTAPTFSCFHSGGVSWSDNWSNRCWMMSVIQRFLQRKQTAEAENQGQHGNWVKWKTRSTNVFLYQNELTGQTVTSSYRRFNFTLNNNHGCRVTPVIHIWIFIVCLRSEVFLCRRVWVSKQTQNKTTKTHSGLFKFSNISMGQKCVNAVTWVTLHLCYDIHIVGSFLLVHLLTPPSFLSAGMWDIRSGDKWKEGQRYSFHRESQRETRCSWEKDGKKKRFWMTDIMFGKREAEKSTALIWEKYLITLSDVLCAQCSGHFLYSLC